MSACKTIAVVVALVGTCLTGSLNAQGASLGISVQGGLCTPDIWAIAPVGQPLMLQIAQPPSGTAQGCKLVIVYSPVPVLGVLDPKNMGIWIEKNFQDCTDIAVKFTVPKLFDQTTWSVQALVLREDGTMLSSNVFTLILDTQMYQQQANPAP